jgi:hypothetical protein
MVQDRKRAVVTGSLFIIATATSLGGNAVLGPALDAPGFLATLSGEAPRVLVSVILKIAAALSSAGIAISLYPVLRRHNEGLALGSVCFRLLEAVFYLVAVLGLLCLLTLSRVYQGAGEAADEQYRVLGAAILAADTWAGFVLGVIAFCAGAAMYYYVLLRTRLVPRWLSAWGLVALAMLLCMVLLVMTGRKASGPILALALPLALQELVLALWLLAKGFETKATAEG